MKRTPQETIIIELARAIEAGKITLVGSVDMFDIGFTTIEVKTLEAISQTPDYFQVKANLHCRRL